MIDWTTWQPQERATLCFIIQDGKILLIRKKRGLGAGKVNGPGGRIDPGETALQAAIRETEEEVCVTPSNVVHRGELFFQFTDGYALHCAVFSATGYEGTLAETDEADPFWVDLNAIPYDEMWEDDRHWLPLMLAEKPFKAYFEFDSETMLSKQIEQLLDRQ